MVEVMNKATLEQANQHIVWFHAHILYPQPHIH